MSSNCLQFRSCITNKDVEDLRGFYYQLKGLFPFVKELFPDPDATVRIKFSAVVSMLHSILFDNLDEHNCMCLSELKGVAYDLFRCEDLLEDRDFTIYGRIKSTCFATRFHIDCLLNLLLNAE